MQKTSSQIFVTIINGKRTGVKQLAADKLPARLPLSCVYANKQSTEKYINQPLHFFDVACGILRGLNFHRRARALFNNEENK